MPTIINVVQKIPAFTVITMNECFSNEPKCRVRIEVEILYPASERDKDCNEQPETRPKNQWFGKDANNKQKA